MNFRKSVRVISVWLRMASLWLWALPGPVELGVFTVFALNLLLWPLPEWLPNRVVAFRLLGVTGLPVILWVVAIRHRLDPFLGRIFRAFAILSSALPVVAASDPDFLSTRSSADRGWTLYDLLWAVFVGGLLLTAFHRGLRKRQQAVPGLVKVLTSGGKNSRRKAILALGSIAHLDHVAKKMDRAAAGEDGLRWLWRPLWLWRSVFKSDTPPAMTDAVPALLGALQDDDLFVRTQAAKLLRSIGEGKGGVKGISPIIEPHLLDLSPFPRQADRDRDTGIEE